MVAQIDLFNDSDKENFPIKARVKAKRKPTFRREVSTSSSSESDSEKHTAFSANLDTSLIPADNVYSCYHSVMCFRAELSREVRLDGVRRRRRPTRRESTTRRIYKVEAINICTEIGQRASCARGKRNHRDACAQRRIPCKTRTRFSPSFGSTSAASPSSS